MRTIGVLAAEHIAAGVVEEGRLLGPVRVYPEAGSTDYLKEMPAPEIVERIRQQVDFVRGGELVAAVGVGFPGIIREGEVDESPNLPQVKGQNLGIALAFLLEQSGLASPVHILNDADAIAAGIAATRGHLDRLIRVWTLGSGIGFGRYPEATGAGEGGHIIVSLDPKEQFCRCGGAGHLEGIMGDRAMRLRFLDLEPEEVFEQARAGDSRCTNFVRLWHRALAAATATSIHLDGPGKFFISGPNARFVQPGMIELYLRELVTMSPLQGSAVEVVSTTDEIAIIGAATTAERFFSSTPSSA